MHRFSIRTLAVRSCGSLRRLHRREDEGNRHGHPVFHDLSCIRCNLDGLALAELVDCESGLLQYPEIVFHGTVVFDRVLPKPLNSPRASDKVVRYSPAVRHVVAGRRSIIRSNDGMLHREYKPSAWYQAMADAFDHARQILDIVQGHSCSYETGRTGRRAPIVDVLNDDLGVW